MPESLTGRLLLRRPLQWLCSDSLPHGMFGYVSIAFYLSKTKSCLSMQNSSRECCFTMVYVTYGTYVNMRFSALELFFGHLI